MIRTEGIAVDFNDFKLRGVDLTVEQGESFFLLGPSGSGKTLLLETLLGIRKPLRGRVYLGGHEVTNVPAEERGVAYVPQRLALFPHMSVRENILYGLKARRINSVDVEKRLDYWVDLLDLERVIDRERVDTLSGGEQQRLALGRALINGPKVLFMDEPFSALDLAQRRKLQIELRHLQKNLGLTLVQVTHEGEEAFLMADHMAILMDGTIAQKGSPSKLYNRPVNLRVARFLMLQNLYPAKMGGTTLDGYALVSVEGVATLEATEAADFTEGSDVYVGIRPEEIILIHPDRSPEDAPRRNLMKGRVEGWLDFGHYRSVQLRVGQLSVESWLGIRVAREFPIEEGMELWLHVRPWSVCILPPQDTAA